MRAPVDPSPSFVSVGGGKQKGTASRAWMVISDSGSSSMEEMGKNSIMKRTGLPLRDLRVLDPILSYSSTILGRERAIVINLEHIKAVVTATEVLVSNSTSPLVGTFVEELQSSVSRSNAAPLQVKEHRDMEREGLKVSLSGEVPNGSRGTPLDVGKDGGTNVVPFEFRALEVCLKSACKHLESETLTLEKEAYPVLDELTSKISSLKLERVRQIKSRLVAISGRVQKVRDELEHLLDDDVDMAEMYLTEKLMTQAVSETSARSHLDNAASESDEDSEDEDRKTESVSSRGNHLGFRPHIEELEMLLEAYFVQIDGTLNKLSTLREYVDDTEDYIDIMLDDKQNQLLQMGVMLNTFTLALTVAVAVVGTLSINIHIAFFKSPSPTFWMTFISICAGIVFMYALAIGWGKKSGLLQ